MQLSVQSLCNRLSRDRLLPVDDIRTLYQRWTREAGAAVNDLSSFAKWLVSRKYVTDYQASILTGRRNERLWIGPFKILTRVGQGRFAGVYKAVHPNGQTVAIKALPAAKAQDANMLARFQRESRLALRLQHPNIVRAFQAGADGDLHFLVMEHLEGETLKDVLLRRSRLPVAEAVRLLYQALQGLQHLHEEGIVHRDLEPGNLMLVPDVAGSSAETTLQHTVKILDVGLGRALFDEGTPGVADAVTGAADQIGTVAYRAPEQTRNAHSADIRADLYSLGCVLFHCLVGDPPFHDRNPVQVVIRHASEKPLPLRGHGLTVPDGLQDLLDALLAKDPALRPATPEQAARELRRFLAG